MIDLIVLSWLVTQIVFIVLKAVGNLDWSWLWVLSPFWMPVGLVVGLYIVLGIINIPIIMWANHKRKKKLGF